MKPADKMTVKITEDIFGEYLDPFTQIKDKVRRFTFSNDSTKTTVQVITLGATITSIKVPDTCNVIGDIVLGFDTVQGYEGSDNPYFGCAVGRVCNRIANGSFILNGERIQVSRNLANKHTLHGGFLGFNKANWSANVEDDRVIMTHINKDGQEGFPGQVTATVVFKLTKDNSFHVNFEATTDKLTVVNLTNHSYFNLAGHDAGSAAIYEHLVKIKADKYTITDEDSIPTGELGNVENTPFDLRTLDVLGPRMQKTPTGGFDDNFCVNLDWNKTTIIAKVCHPKSGRFMEIATNQPGVQLYTSNGMPDPSKNEAPIVGKGGTKYWKHGALCLETQKYPDAVNHENFPSIILNPGENYTHEVIYKFGTSRSDEGTCSKRK